MDSEDGMAWETLTTLLPKAKEIPAGFRAGLFGWMRRMIIHEKEQALEFQTIVRPENIAILDQIVSSIPYTEPIQAAARIRELNLNLEEAEMESAYWAFQHQSIRGELLIENELIPFRLIRVAEFTFVLLVKKENPLIVAAFNEVFKKAADVYFSDAFIIEEVPWSSWAWFMNPNKQVAQQEAEGMWNKWNALRP